MATKTAVDVVGVAPSSSICTPSWDSDTWCQAVGSPHICKCSSRSQQMHQTILNRHLKRKEAHRLSTSPPTCTSEASVPGRTLASCRLGVHLRQERKWVQSVTHQVMNHRLTPPFSQLPQSRPRSEKLAGRTSGAQERERGHVLPSSPALPSAWPPTQTAVEHTLRSVKQAVFSINKSSVLVRALNWRAAPPWQHQHGEVPRQAPEPTSAFLSLNQGSTRVTVRPPVIYMRV